MSAVLDLDHLQVTTVKVSLTLVVLVVPLVAVLRNTLRLTGTDAAVTARNLVTNATTSSRKRLRRGSAPATSRPEPFAITARDLLARSERWEVIA